MEKYAFCWWAQKYTDCIAQVCDDYYQPLFVKEPGATPNSEPVSNLWWFNFPEMVTHSDTERGSAPVLVSELQVSSDRWNVVTSDQPQVSPVWCRDHGQRSSDDFTVRPIFGKRCNFVEKIAAGWARVLIYAVLCIEEYSQITTPQFSLSLSHTCTSPLLWQTLAPCAAYKWSLGYFNTDKETWPDSLSHESSFNLRPILRWALHWLETRASCVTRWPGMSHQQCQCQADVSVRASSVKMGRGNNNLGRDRVRYPEQRLVTSNL